MKNLFFKVVVMFFLAFFEVLEAVKVTPNYKITYKFDGTILFAQCKKTGKFVKHSLAKQEALTYFS